MTEDWAAVAKAINARVNELGWRQRELAERSHVSQAIVREIQHHTVERRRSTRTLEALSTSLGWHPAYLHEVLSGERLVERPSAALGDNDSRALSRLDGVERRLGEIVERLDVMDARLATVVERIRGGQ